MILQGTTPTLTITVNPDELLLSDVTEIELTFQSGAQTPTKKAMSDLTAKIYVPEALIDDYKAASNWKTIDGYGFVEWLPIEGSEFEL